MPIADHECKEPEFVHRNYSRQFFQYFKDDKNEVPLEWKETDYLQKRLELDSDISRLKSISKQLHGKNGSATNATFDTNTITGISHHREGQDQPCITDNIKGATAASIESTLISQKKQIDNQTLNNASEQKNTDDLPKLTGMFKKSKSVASRFMGRPEVKKHSCIDLVVPPRKVISREETSRRLEHWTPRSQKHFKFEDIHPDWELIPNGKTVFPKRVLKCLEVRTSRTDPDGDRNPNQILNAPSWHEVLQQCNISDINRMEAGGENVKHSDNGSKNISIDHGKLTIQRNNCDIRKLPPLNIERECSIQKLPGICLISDESKRNPIDGNIRYCQYIYDSTVQPPTPQTVNSTSSDEKSETFRRKVVATQRSLHENYVKGKVILDSWSVGKSSSDSAKKKPILVDRAVSPSNSELLRKSYSSGQIKNRFEKKDILLKSIKSDIVTRKQSDLINISVSCDDISGTDDGKGKIESSSSKTSRRKKRRRKIEKKLIITSSDEDFDEPVMKYFNLNSKKFLDLIEDVFDTSHDELKSKRKMLKESQLTTKIRPDSHKYTLNDSKTETNLKIHHEKPDNSQVLFIYKGNLSDDQAAEITEKTFGIKQKPIHAEKHNSVKNIQNDPDSQHLSNSSLENDLVEKPFETTGLLNRPNKSIFEYFPPQDRTIKEYFSDEPMNNTKSSINVARNSPDPNKSDFLGIEVDRNAQILHSNLLNFSDTSSSLNMPIDGHGLEKRNSLPSQRYRELKKLLSNSGVISEKEKITKTVNNIYATAQQYDRDNNDCNDTCFWQQSYQDSDQILNNARKFLQSRIKQTEKIIETKSITEYHSQLVCTQSSTEFNSTSSDSLKVNKTDFLKDSENYMMTNSEETSTSTLNNNKIIISQDYDIEENSDSTGQDLSKTSWSSDDENLHMSSIEFHINRLKLFGTNPSKTSLTSNSERCVGPEGPKSIDMINTAEKYPQNDF